MWLLRRVAGAVPSDGADALYVKGLTKVQFRAMGADDESAADTLARASGGAAPAPAAPAAAPFDTTLMLHAVFPVDGRTPPLPRHSIPHDPFWPTTTSSEAPHPFTHDLIVMAAAVARLDAPPPPAKGAAAGAKLKERQLSAARRRTMAATAAAALPADVLAAQHALPTRTACLTPDGIVRVEARTQYHGRRGADDDGDDGGNAAQIFSYAITVTNCSAAAAAAAPPAADAKAAARGKAKAAAAKKGKGKKAAAGSAAAVAPLAAAGRAHHVMLLSRHWFFFDAVERRCHEVSGAGAVGRFPVLAPGESHTWTSHTTLQGAEGVMLGRLQFAGAESGAAPAEGEEGVEGGAAANPFDRAAGDTMRGLLHIDAPVLATRLSSAPSAETQ
jgi:hypothetical protein